MSYDEAINYLNSFLRFGSKLGLMRIENLLQRLGNPQKRLRFIHVAGTNGKGSICAYISSILTCAGYKTGMFTSPYITDIRERFQINGKMIEKDELAAHISQVRAVVDTLPDELLPTEFELITAIGYLYFLQNNCDVVVLEVGLGGRFDSTNTIDTPLCSVIGSIGLDHVEQLGDTVDKIAYQKAGIIKKDGVTVVYPIIPSAAKNVIADVAAEHNNRLIAPDTAAVRVLRYSNSGTTSEYNGLRFILKMQGDNQPYNAAVAVEAVRAAGFEPSDEQIIRGIEATTLPARCEMLGRTRTVILDGAHNADGAAALAALLERCCPQGAVAVMGMMADKDVSAVLKLLSAHFTRIITVTVDNPRSLTAQQLKDIAVDFCPDVCAAASAEQAIEDALSGDNAVCVCGSFYLAGQVRSKLIQMLNSKGQNR